MTPEDEARIDAYVKNLAKDWPPPDSPHQIAVLRRTFGRHLIQEPAAGAPAKKSPAAGRHTPTKGRAA